MTLYACKFICSPSLFDEWKDSYGGGEPFSHGESLWKCIGIGYGHLDAWGYAPANILKAGQVVSQELWSEIPIEDGLAPGSRGLQTRVGHATRGHPYIFTGRLLVASTACGRETYWSPPNHRQDTRSEARASWPCLSI